jgi:hypothetical protein
MQKTKTENIIIEAELPVPLGELAIYALPKKEDVSAIVGLLDNKPYTANFVMTKIVKGIIRKKKLNLKLLKLEYDYSDSNSIDFGVAYFKARLEGMEKNLKRIAGENKVFDFNWEEYKKQKSVETLSAK